MYLLRLKKIKGSKCLYGVENSTHENLTYLADFLEDFGMPIEDTRQDVENFFKNSLRKKLVGDEVSITKRENLVFIVPSYVDDIEQCLYLSMDVAYQIIKEYWRIKEKCPEEIILKLDENMENPIIEIIS